MLEGGIRTRMILESVLKAVEADLTTRGWFDDGQFSPISIIDEYPDDSDEVAVNTIAFSLGDSRTEPTELGGMSEEVIYPIFVDMFAESDGLGRHVGIPDEAGRFRGGRGLPVDPDGQRLCLLASSRNRRAALQTGRDAFRHHSSVRLLLPNRGQGCVGQLRAHPIFGWMEVRF